MSTVTITRASGVQSVTVKTAEATPVTFVQSVTPPLPSDRMCPPRHLRVVHSAD